jgi:hypothetical protein
MGAPIDEWLALAYGRDQIKWIFSGKLTLGPVRNKVTTAWLKSTKDSKLLGGPVSKSINQCKKY